MANFTESFYFGGSVVFAGAVHLPAGAVGASGIAAGANVEASKLEHQYEPVVALCDHATSAAAKRLALHRVTGTSGTIESVGVFVTVAATGNATATVEVKKNGTTVLTAPVTIDNTNAAFALEAGALASTALVAGDVLEAEITAVSAGSGTLPKGVCVAAKIRERAD